MNLVIHVILLLYLHVRYCKKKLSLRKYSSLFSWIFTINWYVSMLSNLDLGHCIVKPKSCERYRGNLAGIEMGRVEGFNCENYQILIFKRKACLEQTIWLSRGSWEVGYNRQGRDIFVKTFFHKVQEKQLVSVIQASSIGKHVCCRQAWYSAWYLRTRYWDLMLWQPLLGSWALSCRVRCCQRGAIIPNGNSN